MPLKPGDVFQLKGSDFHPKAVVTAPNDEGVVLVFGFTDANKLADAVCVFKKDEHPAFLKDTAVAYRRAFILPAAGFQEDGIRMLDRLKPEQLVKILEQAANSEDIEPKHLEMLPKGAQILEFVGKAFQKPPAPILPEDKDHDTQ